MATSDSEDFESADEGINPEQLTAQHKGHKDHCEINVLDGTQLDGLKNKLHEISNTSIPGKLDIGPELQSRATETQLSDGVKMDKVQTFPECCDGNECDERKRQDLRRIKTPMEPKIGFGAKKLGTKMPSFTEVSSLCLKTENTPQKKSDSENTDSLDLQCIDTDEATDGVGWEVEEEGGFEIPVELGDTNKGSFTEKGKSTPLVLDKLAETLPSEEKPVANKGSSWGGWAGWDMSSLLTTASEGVSSLTSHVSAGLITVLESGLGAPNPETLAREQLAQQESRTVEEVVSSGGGEGDNVFGGLGVLMSGVGELGSRVLTGGLDTLETLGKKTMEVLQEGDPGLRRSRALLRGDMADRPVLSQILREAKEKAEESDKAQEDKQIARKAHFETLFDNFHGLVHLEALEMLSRQCELKLQSLLLAYSGDELVELQETLQQVKELCQLQEEEEEGEGEGQRGATALQQFNEEVMRVMDGFQVQVTPARILQVAQRIEDRLSWHGEVDGEEEVVTVTGLHEEAIAGLAEFTAVAMETLHKGAELMLVKQQRSTATEAECLTDLTSLLTGRVSAIANQFTELMTRRDAAGNSSLIINVFLESANSSSYIQGACQLIVPVLQVGATANDNV